jgi:hypothetical protein
MGINLRNVNMNDISFNNLSSIYFLSETYPLRDGNPTRQISELDTVELTKEIDAISVENENIIDPSNEKTLWEQEKEILQLTLIDLVATSVLMRIVEPYLAMPDVILPVNIPYFGNIKVLDKSHHPFIFFLVNALTKSMDVKDFSKGFAFSVCGMSFFTRQINLLSKETIKKILGEESRISKPLLKINRTINDYVPTLLNCFNFHYIHSLVHEYGHYLAIRYFDTRMATIGLSPLGGGSTQPEDSLFQKIFQNYKNALGFPPIYKSSVIAAGPLFQIIFATSGIAASHFQKSIHELSRFLKMTSCLSILHSLEYAYSAVDASGKYQNGDFAIIHRQLGIHPYISMIGIVALPLLVKSGLVLYDRYYKNQDPSEPT